jgi:hypothetical protein
LLALNKLYQSVANFLKIIETGVETFNTKLPCIEVKVKIG